MRRKLTQLKKIWHIFSESNAGTHAAAASYYILLSIPSFFILSASTLPYLPSLSTQMERFFSVSVPPEFLPALSSLLDQFQTSNASVLFPVSFLMVLWSSSKGTAAVLSGLYEAFQLPRNNFLIKRLYGMLFIVLFCLGLIGLYYFSAASYIVLYFTAQQGSFLQVIIQTITKHQILIEFSLLLLLFSLCYKYIFKKMSFPQLVISAGTAAAGWVIISRAFSIYVRWAITKKRIFSVVNILFVGAIWLRISLLVFFYGAVLNRWLVKINFRLTSFFKKGI